MKREKLIWQDGKLTVASDKVSYDSDLDEFIVFELQAVTCD
jgi:hypothetical protein